MKMLLALSIAAAALAQPAIKSVPPAGIETSASDRAELQAGLDHLRAATAKLHGNALLPDVLIYQEAVRYALQYNEFFKADEVAKAKALLQQGEERAADLAQGRAPWTTATGLVVRGYISKIDQSVQPYGLVVPPSYSPTAPHRWRLDAWFHGRNETLSEINFLADRTRNIGEFAPRDTIVLHLYGRFCNASRFAGEVDFFEALDAVKRQYAIDENRILDRGFSMGGASAWDIGTHHAGLWAAVQPGAGFSETVQYLKLQLTGDAAPPWWELKLFHLYDATDYAVNLYNTSTIAYNGEIDPQKQAADMMEQAMAEEGLRLIRLIGPQTAHKYHPDSKIQIANMLDAIAERGRDPYPRTVKFTTWTLAYNRMKWVSIDALGQHWERARVNAAIAGDSAVEIETSNVAAFTLDMGSGGCPLDLARKPVVAIDGQKIAAPGPFSDRSWTVHFRKTGAHWSLADGTLQAGLHKRHGLQGPIDDAFLDSFLFVSPTGSPVAPAVGKWTASEEARAIKEWRREFRGEAQVRRDVDVSDAEIAASNLILWGDPSSNRILARIAGRLPIEWSAAGIAVGKDRYSADTHAPILIYPNPLNPNRYVVLNSGFTFREADYLSNARQTPKLPDYAVVDLTTPPDGRFPGKIVQAGFFNEEWQLGPSGK
jgi:poly(3-hydroxybutyrate) depolymerase